MPRKCKKLPYSKGELNTIVDSLLHPLIKAYPPLIAVDTLLHCLIEQNPNESIRKFIHYNFTNMWEEFNKWLRSQSQNM